MSLFKKARVQDRKFRAAIMGVSNSGKTYTALVLASVLGKKIALIDTEHSSASMYADNFNFDSLNLDSFHPSKYIEAIQAAVKEGYEVIVVDSLSHAWAGKSGALELVDEASARNKGNSFGAWRSVTPLQNQLIDAIITCPAHIICTMRSKTHYQVESADGKTKVTKVGLAPVQRDGIEYEFDFVAEMDTDHRLIVTKSRISSLTDKVILKPDAKFFEEFNAYINRGKSNEMIETIKETFNAEELANAEQCTALQEWAEELGMEWKSKVLSFYKIESFNRLTTSQAETVLARAAKLNDNRKAGV